MCVINYPHIYRSFFQNASKKKQKKQTLFLNIKNDLPIYFFVLHGHGYYKDLVLLGYYLSIFFCCCFWHSFLFRLLESLKAASFTASSIIYNNKLKPECKGVDPASQ